MSRFGSAALGAALCALLCARAALADVPAPTAADRPGVGEAAFPGALALPAGLFNDGEYAAARVEARRVLASAPANGAACAGARLLDALASYLLDGSGELPEIWRDAGAPMAARLQAAYVVGVCAPAAGLRADDRMKALSFVFGNTGDVYDFWNAGALLYFLMKKDRAAREAAPLLWRQLRSCRDVWPVEVARAARKAAEGGDAPRRPPLPVRAVIAFYRGQVGPAIGERCQLEPSCSEFMAQACRAHGLLGVPIGMDRFYREPSVAGDAARAVTMPGGDARYADPVSDHDFWFR